MTARIAALVTSKTPTTQLITRSSVALGRRGGRSGFAHFREWRDPDVPGRLATPKGM
jgi:hypothetical protein